MIGGDHHPVIHDEHADFRLPLQQFREKAYMVMGQGHDNNRKGTFTWRRQRDNKALQGLATFGRSTHPDNGKGCALFTVRRDFQN